MSKLELMYPSVALASSIFKYLKKKKWPGRYLIEIWRWITNKVKKSSVWNCIELHGFSELIYEFQEISFFIKWSLLPLKLMIEAFEFCEKTYLDETLSLKELSLMIQKTIRPKNDLDWPSPVLHITSTASQLWWLFVPS